MLTILLIGFGLLSLASSAFLLMLLAANASPDCLDDADHVQNRRDLQPQISPSASARSGPAVGLPTTAG